MEKIPFVFSPVVQESTGWAGWLSAIVDRLSRNRTSLVVWLVVLQLAVAVLVYVSGGTKFVYPHLMYLPIVLAGVVAGPMYGLAAAIAGGLWVGPLMPLGVADSQPQQTIGWVLRIVFFSLVGLLSGGLSSLLRMREAALIAYTQDLINSYSASLKSLAAVIDSRDHKTADHCDRVAQNALIMGRSMGFSQEKLAVLYWSAILHDLGKLAVPESILSKPGPLDTSERIAIQLHAHEGYRILTATSAGFQPIAEIVVAHHERVDGSGYPMGLKGDKIPLGARILAVLDVFEALTSHRPYRAPMSTDEALEIIRQGSGSHFDPAVVSKFMELIAQGQITYANETQNIQYETAFARNLN
jgi:hypothetical protein